MATTYLTLSAKADIRNLKEIRVTKRQERPNQEGKIR